MKDEKGLNKGNGYENEARKRTYSKAILEIEETGLVDRLVGSLTKHKDSRWM